MNTSSKNWMETTETAETSDLMDAGRQSLDAEATENAPPDSAQFQAGNLLEMLLENSPDAIYFKDRQSRFVQYSKTFSTCYAHGSYDALRGKTDFDVFTEEHARPAFEDEQEILRTGNPMIGKLEKETYADGRVSWALTSKMPWRDKQGKIIGTFGISKDVTGLKKAEEKLAEQKELLRTLLDNIPDCIWFKDRQSRFVQVSHSKLVKSLRHVPRLQKLVEESGCGPDKQLLLGLTDFDLCTDDHARQAFEEEQEIIRTGQPLIDNLEKQSHPDGSITWSLCTKMPWRDQEGQILGTFGVSRDITALKRAEAELEATHRRLLDASRLAGMAEVATDVLHNVGNTLNSINVSCALVIDRTKGSNFTGLARIPQLLQQHAGALDEFLTCDPQGKHIPQYLAALAQSYESQKELILGELAMLRKHVDHVNQIVAMQQVYSKVAGVEESVAAAQLVEDALHINAAALDRHGLQVRREFEPVPALFLDKHKVLQILVNLIRNAKYAVSETNRTDKLLTLRICRQGTAQVLIEVIDNGVGIPAENLNRIFSHGFTTRRDGHGFGLHSGALAAHDLNGTLTAHSDGPAKGATFTLTLPIKTP